MQDVTAAPSVLFVSPTAEAGGSDQALLSLVGQLVGAGWTCHVALPGPSPLAAAYARLGVPLHEVPMQRITTGGGWRWWVSYAARWPGSVVALTRLARAVSADLVASNSLHSWYGWAAAALARRPHVWHAREIVVQSRWALRLERLLTRRAAALVVACSQAAAAQLPGARVVVVHEDVDRSRFSPARAGRFRAGLGLPPHVRLVGFVGRLDTWKGVEVAGEAFARVRAADPTVHLAVVGGPVRGKEAFHDALRDRAARLPGVHWVGPRSDIPEVMADLDVLLAPSTLPEPYGLVLVEALASGARVVATDRGGPPEILARAAPGAGRLVPPGDVAATAAALADLLSGGLPPPGPARPVLLPPQPTDWAGLYAGVLDDRTP